MQANLLARADDRIVEINVAFDVAFGGKADMAYCSAHVCF
jgi:hypothetical protein